MVFSVIVENIKSFFSKEDSLEGKPKALPRTASDVFENEDKKLSGSKSAITNVEKSDDKQSGFEQKILDKQLPKSQGLKFSTADLKKKLAEKKNLNKPVSKGVERTREQEEIISHDDIRAFEQAINGMPEEVVVTNDDSSIYLHEDDDSRIKSPMKKDYLTQSTTAKKILEGGFFSEYEKHLNEKDYKLDPEKIDGQALIEKMYDYHDNKSQGKAYYIHREELENAIKKKIADLKEYEYEWFDLKERKESIKRSMFIVEEEIKKRSSELKSLVKQINSEALIMPPKKDVKQEEQEEQEDIKKEDKQKERKEQEVQQVQQVKASEEKVEHPREKEETKTQTIDSNAFYLANGEVINNLDELRDALREMPDSIFYQHVSPNRNDFANWIADSLKREEIAIEVRKTTNKYEMLNKLNHDWA